MKSKHKKAVEKILPLIPSTCPKCGSKEINFMISKTGDRLLLTINHDKFSRCQWCVVKEFYLPQYSKG